MKDQFSIQIATLDDIGDVVRMRLLLQQHLHRSNPQLWQMSEDRISGLPAFYRSVIVDKYSRLLIVHDNESV